MRYDDWGWKPYVTVGERRRQAALAMQQRQNKGLSVSPVVIEGRKIATTFWGKAWCENLERYSDYSNRLPRGRTYVRNGSVVDLQITLGAIHASVMGSSLYPVEIGITPVKKAQWMSICNDCAGAIDSLVELLQGKFSTAVMERICRQQDGLFPSPREIQLSCSCPDWAGMCKHVAAVLYGIGARFDHQPELLFRLRGVDEMELIAKAGSAAPLTKDAPDAGRMLAGEDLSAMFGIDLAGGAELVTPPAKKTRAQRSPAKKSPAMKKAANKRVPRKSISR